LALLNTTVDYLVIAGGGGGGKDASGGVEVVGIDVPLRENRLVEERLLNLN
jgi:hypothetical protein